MQRSGRAASLTAAATGRAAIVEAALAEADAVPGFGSDLPATIGWCVRVGAGLPLLGDDTATVWELLAETAHRDVAAARILEPHLDALNILSQASRDSGGDRTSDHLATIAADEGSSWGVFAAEGPGMRLEAHEGASGWELSGTKPWCSLAHDLSHALVTAFVGDDRRLFAVSLRSPHVRPHDGPWVARGLPGVVSAPVDFHRAPAVPVGETGWYLTRPGFAWGGMSVAACWWGGALGLQDALASAAAKERADQVALLHLGRADAALWAARSVLREAAALLDGGAHVDMKLLAARVRATVADAATTALANADAALGPSPLVSDEDYARRAADLHLYLRQHHGLRDEARLGKLALSERPQ